MSLFQIEDQQLNNLMLFSFIRQFFVTFICNSADGVGAAWRRY